MTDDKLSERTLEILHSLALEGLRPSARVMEAIRAYDKGEITLEQLASKSYYEEDDPGNPEYKQSYY